MAITGSGKGIQIIVGADYNGRDLARAQRDLNRLQREAAKTQGPMAALGGKLKGMVGPAMLTAGAAAAGFAVKLGVDAVQGAMAEQQELAKLQTALDNVGQGFKMPEVDAFISKLQMAYGVSDSELRPAFQTLVTATGDVAKSMDLMNLAVDMNAAGVGDLATISGALAKASQGNYKSLNSLTKGAIDPATLASKDLSQITSALAQKFGGSAAANAKTFAGGMARLNQAAGELSDSFGQGFISAFDGSTESVDKLQQSLIDLQPTMESIGRQIGDLTQGFASIAGSDIGGFFVRLVGQVKGPIPVLADFIGQLRNGKGAADALAIALGYASDWIETHKDLTQQDRDAVTKWIDEINRSKIDGDWLSGANAALQELYDKADAAKDKVKALADVMANTGAFMEFQAALDGVKDSTKENGDALTVYNDKGRANVKALRDMISAASDAAGATGKVSEQARIGQAALDILTGALKGTKMDDATRTALLEPFQALIDQLAQSGVDVSGLQSTIDSLQGKTVTVKASTGVAETDIAALKQAMEGIDTYIPVQIDVQITGNRWTNQDLNGNGIPDILEEASGGYVRGPGGPTTDSIPARLSNGEFVIRAASVRQFGPGFFDALNRGIMPDSARVRGPMHGVTMAPSTGGTSSGFAIDTINVISAPGERAEESVPRALRRAAFLAGV